MEYNKELEDSIIEYIDLPDPIDKVAEEKEIAYENGKYEGRLEGHYEGQKEGLEDGMKIGLESGEQRTKSLIANNMYAKGVSISKIADYINVPVGDVKSMFINEPIENIDNY